MDPRRPDPLSWTPPVRYWIRLLAAFMNIPIPVAGKPSSPRARKGIWFPLLLGFLLLLAVPGMVFLALSLFGKENAVNGWMKDHLGLTYHIPVPWWAALILLLTPFLILLLYFLKMKRRPLQVPSTYLWKKSIEDLHVNSLFQWMRDNVLLLVQLLIVLILIYGVLALQAYAAQGSGKHYILLIDSSASMAVADADGGTRLNAAKKAALQTISSHGEGDVGMVIEFNSVAEVRQKYTTDVEALRRAVGAVQQTSRATHLEEALNLADSLANPTKSTANQAVIPEGQDPTKARTYVDVQLGSVPAEVHLFSDGRFADVADFAAGNLDIRYHRCGAEGQSDNLAIVAFNAQRDDKSAGSLRVFLRVLNFRGEGAHTQVKLDEMDWTKDNQLQVVDSHIKSIDVGPLTVIAGDAARKEPPVRNPGEEDVTFEVSDAGDGSNRVLRASLVDNKDVFPADDTAWLAAGAVRKAHVLVVTDDDEVLKKFFGLEATKKVAVVTFIKTAELKDEAKYLRPAQIGAFDLVVFDRCRPDDAAGMPLSNTYFIDDVPPPWKKADMPELKDAHIRNPTSKHPLMEGASGLDEIIVFDAFRFELDPDKNPGVPPRVPRLLEIQGAGAVLFALPREGFTDLVQTFPLVNDKGEWTTDWMKRYSFPKFLRNVVYQLGNVSDGAAEGTPQPGQLKSIRPEATGIDAGPAAAGPREVRVWDEARQTWHDAAPGPSRDFLVKDTEDIGVYLATWEPGGRRAFAVNLLDENESDVRPRDEVKVGAEVLQATAAPHHGEPIDLWPFAALAALALLLVEWALYYFRVFG